MNFVKSKKQIITAVVASSLLWGISSTPAKAVTLDFLENTPLSNLLEQVQRFINEAENYITQAIADKIKPLEQALNEDLASAINEAKGVLGLPDPIATRKGVEETLAQTSSAVNPLERATNEVDRQVTRASAAAVLSQQGQQQTQEEIAATKQSVDAVQQQAQQAAQEVVTQNVMKRIAQQNVQISGTLGALRKDSLQTAQRQELANINLTNISRSIDGQNQARSNEVVGAGIETLRITSQAKLF